MKSLSEKGYPVWYVANSVLEPNELFEGASKDLDLVVAAIDVSNFSSQHEFVTYTQTSSYAMLHSDPIRIERERFKGFKNRLISIFPATASVLEADLIQIPRILFGSENKILEQFSFSRSINVVENWSRMTRLIFLLTGLKMYKWMSL